MVTLFVAYSLSKNSLLTRQKINEQSADYIVPLACEECTGKDYSVWWHHVEASNNVNSGRSEKLVAHSLFQPRGPLYRLQCQSHFRSLCLPSSFVPACQNRLSPAVVAVEGRCCSRHLGHHDVLSIYSDAASVSLVLFHRHRNRIGSASTMMIPMLPHPSCHLSAAPIRCPSWNLPVAPRNFLHRCWYRPPTPRNFLHRCSYRLFVSSV